MWCPGFGMWNYWLMWFIIIVIIVAVVYYSRGDRSKRGVENPLDILDGRYARGEINRDTYIQMKKDITGK